MPTHNKKWIAGFWQRSTAIAIDILIVMIIGFCIWFIFSNQLVAIGKWGTLISLCITLPYFGLMNSRLCNGQTIGKKILHIRVVDENNNTISIKKSLLRFGVLAPVFIDSGLMGTTSFTSCLFSFLIDGILISNTYLIIFNRRTRQLLHDFAVDTLVVNINAEIQEVDSIWQPHFYMLNVLFLFAGVISVFVFNETTQTPPQKLTTIETELSKNSLVDHANVIYGYKTLTDDKKISGLKYIQAEVFIKENNINDENFALQVKNVINRNVDTQRVDAYEIILIYGNGNSSSSLSHGLITYNVGIGTITLSRIYMYSPTLIGSWSWTVSNGCVETYQFNDDGTGVIHSGEEKTDITYKIYPLKGANRFPVVVHNVKDYGGKDCADATDNGTGTDSEFYIHLIRHENKLLHCGDATGTDCWILEKNK